jgi:hypothetical protein
MVLAPTLALLIVTVACGDSAAQPRASGSTATASTPTTLLPPTAFVDAVRTRDLDALVATFADDIALYSPILEEPFVGRARVSRLFGVLVDVFGEIAITDEIATPGRFVLGFTTSVGDEALHVVDLLTFDADGLIKTFVVTTRLLAGTQALATAVAPHLAAIG